MNEKEIDSLLERFFNGETTLDEERLLYRHFASGEVSQAHLPLRQMFLDMPTLQGIIPKPLNATTIHHKRPRRRLAIAAAILSTAGFLAATYLAQASNNECEMLVYGKKVTAKEIVMSEVRSTIGNACENANDVNDQLKEIFRN